MINITDNKVEQAIPPWLRLGFRPFFLLGAIYAIVSIAVWAYLFQRGQPEALQVPSLWWHGHEMLFGFAMAIVAGFVLTAVQNWTGQAGTKHHRLFALVLLWLIPRVLFWLPIPIWVAALVETLFLVALAYEVGSRVVKAKGWRNLFFVPLFLAAMIANALSYTALTGIIAVSASAIWQAMLWWFALLLSVMGGRVIPFFSAKRFNFTKPQPLKWLEWAANLPLMALFLLSFSHVWMTKYGSTLMLVAGVFQLWRWCRWLPWKTISEPLVWSLMLSYVCLPLSLLARGLVDDALASHTLLHLFAVGALGGLILAMISRVTMGHTGRAIYEGPNMSLAFIAIILAAVVRGFAAVFWPQHLFILIDISATLWVFAFAMFCLKFGYMLVSPRVDGHPG
ncbi:NnrS family protein [Vibrio hippocampi]|uniref:Short-chain dehydrogenase n=1 Tax=Vibrio hippocampi TaxID=654686 RepID=A0ABM8ZF30_9VIBR|nr:NnrS family protein [Vibrio hippocampi]CAH0525032.1 hypothetical protein VHP8226_00697 [Vibrio hippocampi]